MIPKQHQSKIVILIVLQLLIKSMNFIFFNIQIAHCHGVSLWMMEHHHHTSPLGSGAGQSSQHMLLQQVHLRNMDPKMATQQVVLQEIEALVPDILPHVYAVRMCRSGQIANQRMISCFIQLTDEESANILAELWDGQILGNLGPFALSCRRVEDWLQMARQPTGPPPPPPPPPFQTAPVNQQPVLYPRQPPVVPHLFPLPFLLLQQQLQQQRMQPAEPWGCQPIPPPPPPARPTTTIGPAAEGEPKGGGLQAKSRPVQSQAATSGAHATEEPLEMQPGPPPTPLAEEQPPKKAAAEQELGEEGHDADSKLHGAAPTKAPCEKKKDKKEKKEGKTAKRKDSSGKKNAKKQSRMEEENKENEDGERQMQQESHEEGTTPVAVKVEQSEKDDHKDADRIHQDATTGDLDLENEEVYNKPQQPLPWQRRQERRRAQDEGKHEGEETAISSGQQVEDSEHETEKSRDDHDNNDEEPLERQTTASPNTGSPSRRAVGEDCGFLKRCQQRERERDVEGCRDVE